VTKKTGFTQISNDILDEKLADMTLAEIKVFLAICRKTSGWHKENDVIPNSQLMKISGIKHRPTLKKTILSLSEKNIIAVNRTGTGQATKTIYELKTSQKHCKTNGSLNDPLSQTNGSLNDPLNGSLNDPSKYNNKYNNINNNNIYIYKFIYGDFLGGFSSAAGAFASFAELYPAEPSSSERRAAEQAFDEQARRGATANEIIRGAEQYKKFCDATHRAGTHYVKNIKNFLSEELYKKNWEIKNATRQTASQSRQSKIFDSCKHALEQFE